MQTLQEIEIKCTTNDNYKTTIALVTVEHLIYYEFVRTNHNGVKSEFGMHFENYHQALEQFLKDVKEYANHTALMNL